LIILGVGIAVFLVLTQYSRSHNTTPGRDTSDFTIQAVPRHIEQLKAADTAARQKAATALWQIGPGAREALPALAEATRDPASEVRVAAVKALGQTTQGTTEAVPALVEALKDKEADVRAESAASLGQIFLAEQKTPPGGRGRREHEEEERRFKGRGGRSGKAELEEREEREQAREPKEEQSRLGELILKLKPEGEAAARTAVPALTPLLQDENPRVRARAASTLAETGPLARPALEKLIEILEKDADADCRLQASIALGQIGPEADKAVPVLAKRLRNDEYGTRANCAASLARIRAHPEVAIPALVDAYLKDSGDVYNWATIALNLYGETAAKFAAPLLRQAVKAPENVNNKQLQERAARALEISEGRLKETATSSAGKRSSRP
jgi:hypothetical protein